MNSLYKKYIFKSFFIRFIFITWVLLSLFLFFFYSTMGGMARRLHEDHILVFLLCGLLKYLQILLPFSFTLALVLFSCHMNHHLELVSFQSCGLSLRKIFKPILSFSIFLSLFLALNNQFFVPKLEKKLELERSKSKGKGQKSLNHQIHTKSLEDNSLLVYSVYDLDREEFHDVFWVKNDTFVWHIDTLRYESGKMKAQSIDVFEKDPEQGYRLDKHFNTLFIPEMPIIDHQQKVPINSELFSLSDLVLQLINPAKLTTKEYLRVESLFWKKINFLLLTPLLFLIFTPILTPFSRFRKTYRTISISIIAFLFFFSIIDTSATLVAHNIISGPISCIGFNLLFGIPGIYYYFKS